MRSMLATRLYSLAWRSIGAFGLVVLISVSAQGQDVIGSQRRQATRAELEQAASAAEAAMATSEPRTQERLSAQVAAIRQRLRNGDFAPGDRLLLSVIGDSALSDTFTVRQDQGLLLPSIPEINLRGVLDSELSAFLTKELTKYIKNPQVTATGLIRLSMMGAIVKPGFMTVPTDQLVTDVVMAAGGPAQTGKFDASYVRRGDKTILNRKQFAEAVRTGKTIGDLSLRDGDEIFVPIASAGQSRLQIWLPVLTAATTVYWISRGGRRSRP